jgi:N-acetylmuramoyl-L-alanine amidase
MLVWCALWWAPTVRAQWDERVFEGERYVAVDAHFRKFYQFTNQSPAGKALVLQSDKVMMRIAEGSAECTLSRLNATPVKFVFSHPVRRADGKLFMSVLDLLKLLDPVMRPAAIKNAGRFATVILDAGHGGGDPGATNAYGTEAALNLTVAGLVRQELESPADPRAMRFKVVMTRTSDRFLTLQQRVDVANRVRENAIFVSIHFNSGRSGARGIETFTLSPPGVAHYGRGKIAADALSRPGNVHDAANVALATAVHGMCLVGLGRQNTFDRGIKRARFTVLTGVRHPAILLEGGFMSHPQEARLINTPAYRQQLARAVAAGIRRYCGAVSQPPPAPAGTKR